MSVRAGGMVLGIGAVGVAIGVLMIGQARGTDRQNRSERAAATDGSGTAQPPGVLRPGVMLSPGAEQMTARRTRVTATDLVKVDTLDELLTMEPVERRRVDIARANLLVASAAAAAGSPSAAVSPAASQKIDIDACLATLDAWAARVAAETDRHYYRFLRDPAAYRHSEGYFRVLMLVTVLQQDCKVAYNPERIDAPDFTNPADLFIHGMIPNAGGLSESPHSGGGAFTKPPPGGTCVSMPVLYTAVARRLGYPVRLVTTKAHVFARWDGVREGEGAGAAAGEAPERFNIEATGRGLNVYDDEHYQQWPVPLTDDEIASGAYLRSLDADAELAIFMTARGHLLEDTGRIRAAVDSYRVATGLDPRTPRYEAFLDFAQTLAEGGRRDRGHRARRDPHAELERVMEINRRNAPPWDRPGG